MSDAPDYRALYEEAERRRQEAEQRRQEAEQRQQEAELEAQRARQTIQETSTFNWLLQKELAELRKSTARQSLQAYLAQVSKLHIHLARLIPGPQQPRPGPKASSSSPTTSGRTDIARKYYPLRLRRWEDFDAVQRRIFSRIYTTLQDRQVLPSRQSVQHDEASLLEQLPLGVLNLSGSMTEARTTEVVNLSLLLPASRIINEYLADTDTEQKMFFDTHTYGAAPESAPGSSAGTDSEDNARRLTSNSERRVKKVMPDCLLLTMPTVVPGQAADDSETAARRAAIGEHKPAHAVRGTHVVEIVGHLPESYMLMLARETLARRSTPVAPASDELAGGLAGGEGMASTSASTRPVEGGDSSTRKITKQTYFAYALTQTYHYMIITGVPYGYLCTGETITFLYIRGDDPGTLFYHTSSFPLVSLEDVRSAPGPVTTTPVDDDTTLPDVETLSKMAIAELCSFCLLALDTDVRSADWTAKALAHLAQFPELPASLAAARSPGPSSLGTRRRDSDDDGDNERNRPPPPPPDGSYGSARGHGPSPLRHEVPRQDAHSSIEGHQRSVFTGIASSTLSYCTQACLLGLVHGGELDTKCPNYRLHLQSGSWPGHRHSITQDEFTRRVREQLFNTPSVNCKCYLGNRGCIGFFFKITLTGFGYTFVGKAVEEHYRRRLVHETEIYSHLLPLQGVAVPVHLGLVDLIVPYPERETFTLLKTMMLLSYAGRHIPSDDDEDDGADLPSDLKHEIHRTLQELGDLGLWDKDSNPDNIMWCDDVQRVMRIDFDRAVIVPSRDKSRVSDAPATPGTGDTAPMVNTALGDGKDQKDRENGEDEEHGEHGEDGVVPSPRPSKRPRYEGELAGSHAESQPRTATSMPTT
ncbi:hypothetical protein Sste5346_009874 [Sporothrix stenoceras]|uniref:Protein kinase-like domain protein n=1 Tax=Sporothrix stenoceras TaxID=5173 RepID=A0ABR3YKH3_9PEZI